MMIQEQADRCLMLASFLRDKVPSSQFDQGSWATANTREASNKVCSVLDVCGTSACALGWTTAIWPEQFRLAFNSCEHDDEEPVVQASVEVLCEGEWWEEYDYGHLEVLDWFGFTDGEADRVFGTKQMTPVEKAEQIEEIVRWHGYDVPARNN